MIDVAHCVAGRPMALRIAEALRTGLYEIKPEVRVVDRGAPRLLDLVPKDEQQNVARATPGATMLPVIRLRSLVPTRGDFDAFETVAVLYETAANRPFGIDLDPTIDQSERMADLNSTMLAAIVASLTPGMIELAGQRSRVCAITCPMPWSDAHVAVLRQSPSGQFEVLETGTVDPEIATGIRPTLSIVSGGSTLKGEPVQTIEAALAFSTVEQLPSAMDAMRILANTAIGRHRT